MTRQAVILAGGKGTRLAERLGGLPKPLIDVDGIPLLGRQLGALRDHGFTRILLLVNHQAERIAAFCRAPDFADLEITLLDDGAPRGTAGALAHAYDALDARFLTVYGDTFFDIDLTRFWEGHAASHAEATLFLHPNDHPFDSDIVEIDDDRRIRAFHAAPHPPDGCLPNLVNAALYVIERDSLAFWRDAPVPSDIARDLFPSMLARGARLRGEVGFDYIKDIGTPKRLDKAVAHLREGRVARARRGEPQRAVFLDRDGTINESRGHLSRAEDLVLIPGVGEAVRSLNDAEYRVVVATNQPVLARGACTAAEMLRIHGRLETLLGAEGAFLDGIEYCPHHPDAGFPGEVPSLKMACTCRKPGIGMIERARAAMNIELTRSWFVGDSTGDMVAADRAGLRSVLVETGEAGRDARYPVRPDFVLPDLLSASRFIVESHPRLERLATPLAADIPDGALVLLGGLAKQGKSSVASVLRHQLVARGREAKVISLDGFLRDEGERRATVKGRFDLSACAEALGPWLQGGAAELRVPLYDRQARRRFAVPLRLSLNADSILILEGVPALMLPIVTTRPVLRLFLQAPEERRRMRVLQDFARRGLDTHAAIALYAAREEDETPFVLASADGAHLIQSP